ncbi:MAG TPA: Holliday junction resolvase RuvX [Candidatus Paceibacterota bacterium]|nr:Holliday junction resolvase RuvX [Candidatus Paceibacterota bacterium]HMP18962.1 Holliday junction resolvase RuvX [Candidatus Paceibacterota bacterium]HMP85573.1 Holliday junction resolvase RuvX [Candidatus Paceibacterota bacterium]
MTNSRNQKHMGIDYGTKKIGIAISDDNGRIAFPKTTLNNDSKIIENLKKIISDNKITKIVIGESKNYKMQDNEIMKDILELKKVLETLLEADVILQPEFLTSVEALKMGSTQENINAGAAAVILQSYLDSLK